MTPTATQDISSLPQVAEALESLAYTCQTQDEAVVTFISVNENKFPVVISLGGPNDDELVFNVEICKLENVANGEDPNSQIQALAQLLSMNKEFCPFASALLDAEDGLDPSDPVVLLDSIKIGDLSVAELDAEMNAARRALQLAIHTIELTEKAVGDCCCG